MAALVPTAAPVCRQRAVVTHGGASRGGRSGARRPRPSSNHGRTGGRGHPISFFENRGVGGGRLSTSLAPDAASSFSASTSSSSPAAASDDAASGAQAPKLKVAVIGAGPCGLTTALALRKMGFDDVTVFDKFPEIRPAMGAAFNLNGGAAVLAKLGLLGVFRALSNPMQVVRTRRVAADRTLLMNIGERSAFVLLLNAHFVHFVVLCFDCWLHRRELCRGRD